MLAIVLNSFVFLGAITLGTYVNQFFLKYSYNNLKKSPLYIMGAALLLCSVLNIAMLLEYDGDARYILYTVDRFFRLLFIAEAVILSRDYSAVPDNHISFFISFFAYSSVTLYFVDTIICKGNLNSWHGSFYIYTQNLYHRIICYCVLTSYIIYFLSSFIYKRASILIKRDKPEQIYFSLSFLCCIFSYTMDLIALDGASKFFLPHTFFDFFTFVFLYKMVQYHRSIIVYREDYAEELSPDKTDVVFVLDDRQKIIYQSKRAEIVGYILEDSFLGRDFFDVFKVSEKEKLRILGETVEEKAGTEAEYIKLSKHVNLLVENRIDYYGAILSSCIKVYNLEPKEMGDDVDSTTLNYSADNIEKLLDDAIEITSGTNVVVVGEDCDFSKELLEELKLYSINASLCADCDRAKSDIFAGKYNLAFLCDTLPDKKAFELSKEIRGIQNNEVKEMPLILVSSTNINNIFMDMLDAEFTDYIYNPLDKIQLDSCLKRWLREQ